MRSSDAAVPVYWLNGNRVSQDYGSTAGTGFWPSSGYWEVTADANWKDRRDELGRDHSISSDLRTLAQSNVFTGTSRDGTKSTNALGAAQVVWGNWVNPIQDSSRARIGTLPFYGVSPVYVVGGYFDDCDDGDGDVGTARLFVTATVDAYCYFRAPSGRATRTALSASRMGRPFRAILCGCC